MAKKITKKKTAKKTATKTAAKKPAAKSKKAAKATHKATGPAKKASKKVSKKVTGSAKKPAKRVKKAPAKKAPTKKAPTKRVPTKKVPAKKSPVKKPAKKAPAKKPAKKVPAKKVATKKKSTTAKSKRTDKAAEASAPAPPAKPRRITKMSLDEVLISIGTLEGNWSDLGWLQGLYLYGQDLKSTDYHREFSFIVVYRGLSKSSQIRKARADLDAILAQAAPVHRTLNFIPTIGIIEQMRTDNPAVNALLGHTVPIFVR